MNRLRKADAPAFPTLRVGPIMYALNPVLTGRGSREPLVEIDTLRVTRLQLTKVQAARAPTGSKSPGSQQPVQLGADLGMVQRMLGEIRMRNATGAGVRPAQPVPTPAAVPLLSSASPSTAFIMMRKGVKFFVTADMKYDTNMHNRAGDSIRRSHQQTVNLPEPRSRDARFHLVQAKGYAPSTNLSRGEAIELMADVLRSMFSADIPPEVITCSRIVAVPATATGLATMPLGSVRMLYTSIDNIAAGRPGDCDYLLSVFHQPESRMNYITRQDIVKAFPRKQGKTV